MMGLLLFFTVESPDTTMAIPFITTRTGFRLYEAENFSGYRAQTFEITIDNKALVSTEASNVKLTGPDNLSEYFISTSVNWKMDNSAMSDNVAGLYDKVINSVRNNYSGASGIYVALTGILSKNVFSLRLGFIYKKKTVTADLYFDYLSDNTNQITLSYKNGVGNNAGEALVKSIAGYEDMAKLVSDEFNLSSSFPMTVTNLIFTKSNDNSTYLSVKR